MAYSLNKKTHLKILETVTNVRIIINKIAGYLWWISSIWKSDFLNYEKTQRADCWGRKDNRTTVVLTQWRPQTAAVIVLHLRTLVRRYCSVSYRPKRSVIRLLMTVLSLLRSLPVPSCSSALWLAPVVLMWAEHCFWWRVIGAVTRWQHLCVSVSTAAAQMMTQEKRFTGEKLINTNTSLMGKLRRMQRAGTHLNFTDPRSDDPHILLYIETSQVETKGSTQSSLILTEVVFGAGWWKTFEPGWIFRHQILPLGVALDSAAASTEAMNEGVEGVEAPRSFQMIVKHCRFSAMIIHLHFPSQA